jgi:hypothetical protein
MHLQVNPSLLTRWKTERALLVQHLADTTDLITRYRSRLAQLDIWIKTKEQAIRTNPLKETAQCQRT